MKATSGAVWAIPSEAWLYSDNLQRWIADALAGGTAPEALAARLVARGARPQAAAEAVEDVLGTPGYLAAARMAERLARLERLFELQEAVRRSGADADDVPRRIGLGPDRFLAEHWSVSRPVVLEDVVCEWPAWGRWTPEYLREAVGAAPVEAMTQRDLDPRYEVNFELHRTTLPMAAFVDRVLAESPTNDLYMVANNTFFAHPAAAPLLEEIGGDERYLLDDPEGATTYLWLGPAGTRTPLHHDTSNVLLAQLYGTKRVLMLSPYVSHRVANEVSVYSEVDVWDPDVSRHPRFAGLEPIAVELEPGDALFVPVGWWHAVEAREISISVSFTSFRFANHYALG
jgi:Cupin-like domain